MLFAEEEGKQNKVKERRLMKYLITNYLNSKFGNKIFDS